MPAVHASASQLLELNLLSARDLATVSKSMKVFAVAWINPNRKLQTRRDETGGNNPTWNEKVAFRVDDDFLAGDSSTITIELRASNRRGNVVVVGTVSVLVASLFPSLTLSPSQKRSFSKTRFLTLQVRRPSGRPQGVLDVGVALLDGSRRSMPLSSDLTASAFGNSDLMDARNDKERKHRKFLPNKIKLLHSKSQRSISDYHLLKPANGSLVSRSNGKEKDSFLSSDIGPSPSLVAAAIGMGIYPAPKKALAADEVTESSILDDWIEEDDSVEGLKTKIERWRSEIHPLYQSQCRKNLSHHRENYKSTHRPNELTKKKDPRRGGLELFSCFGTAYGCEFKITCGGGGGNRRRKNRSDGDDVHLSISEIHYDDPNHV